MRQIQFFNFEDQISPATKEQLEAQATAKFVFGNEVGEQIGSIKTAWRATCRRARIRGFHFQWEAPVFLLETLMDPDDGVRRLAVRLVDRWIESFNRNHTQPTAMQLQRIGALLDSVASRMPEKTAKMLRFSIKPS